MYSNDSYVSFGIENVNVSHTGIVLPFEFLLHIEKYGNRKIDLIKDLRVITQSKTNGVFSLGLSNAKSIIEFFMFNPVTFNNIETIKKGEITNSHSTEVIRYEFFVSNHKIFVAIEVKLYVQNNYSSLASAYRRYKYGQWFQRNL